MVGLSGPMVTSLEIRRRKTVRHEDKRQGVMLWLK
jgi:hypothetical protein